VDSQHYAVVIVGLARGQLFRAKPSGPRLWGEKLMCYALTRRQRAGANYPFCTIEPNVGEVAVPDPRARQADLRSPIGTV